MRLPRQAPPSGRSTTRQILYAGQPIALVVAEEFEIARYAATLVAIEYEAAQAVTDIVAEIDKAYEPKVPRMLG